MKISYNWVRDIAPVDWSAEEMAHRLTLAGTACETVIDLSARFSKMVVGKVESCVSIEKSDHLRHATVSTGKETLSIICGAPNVAAGQLVAVAQVGAVMPDGMKIERRKMFGIASEGMILSERELEISDEHEGIIVLAEDLQVGAPLATVFGINDYTLEFELTPNRPDSMCAIGIARDVAALSGCGMNRPEITLEESSEKSSKLIKVEIEDTEFCPRYAARVIRNVTIGPSPGWLRDRLVASGQTSINNVVDVTNYVMMEYGQPLHAFDLRRFDTGKVVVKRAKAKEKFVTLDEVEREVDESVLMITNGDEYLAAGGVMGGLNSSITDDTQDVLLEAAYFDPSSIRKSKRKLGLSTDSSARFERGIDPNITLTAIDRAAQLLAEVAGGTPLSGSVDNYPEPIEPLAVELKPERCNQILGTEVKRERIESILSGLELEVRNPGSEAPIAVTVPTFRPDITREIDLIEEVTRIYGFDNIPTTKGYLAATDNRKTEPVEIQDNLVATLRNTLLGVGFNEICGSGLADGRLLEIIDPGEPQIEIANPVSDEFGSMRNSLAYSLLSAARVNVTHQTVDLQLFELGNIYGPGIGKKDNVLAADNERMRLGALVTGQVQPHWKLGRENLDFYTLKGLIAALCSEARLGELELSPSKSPMFQPGQSFVLRNSAAGAGEVGRIGNVSSKLLKRFDIKQPVSLLELDIAGLSRMIQPGQGYRALSKFPASDRDLSLLLDEGVLVGEMLDGVERVGGDLVERAVVFDLFRGKQVPQGKKSVAISIRYRSADKSLESSEVDGLQQKIIVYLKQEFKAEIREK
jgi:phenylalanyl-tRNA synthetase beta chain